MRSSLVPFAALLFVSSVVACTTETIVVPVPTPSPSATDDPPGTDPVPTASATTTATAPPTPTTQPTTPKADVRVSIGKVLAHYRIGATASARGKEIEVLPVTFENRGAVDLPFTIAKLSLESKTGAIEPVFAAATKLTSKPCSEVTALRVGQTVECSVAFDVAQDSALRLRYQVQNDVRVDTPVPKVTRCHDLVHVGQSVANIGVTTTPPLVGGTLPADGTYVAQYRFSRTATTDTYPAFTLRIANGVADEAYTLEGTTLQMRYALTSEDDFARLDLSCVSPAYDEAQRIARTVFYWDSSAQLLYMAVGGSDTWLGLRKVP